MDLAQERCRLPIYAAREALIREIRKNTNCVIVGETGSGKTTQIPQYVYESGLTRRGPVAVTQPRRVAAVSIAKRVAAEMSVPLGQAVGYSVRFDECCSSDTRIKYLTDGMLLRESISDPLLMRYSMVVLDEAHERTLHTDVLLGVVKLAQRQRQGQGRRKLRIIVMSATLEAEEFSLYLDIAKILYIQGRLFPVQVFYAVHPQSDYLHSALITVLQLNQELPEGDILVFLTGQEEIEMAAHILTNCQLLLVKEQQEMFICQFFAALPVHCQQRVFEPTPPGTRKVVLSTNIAETSITLPGIRYVVDTGVVKARGYNPRLGLDYLLVQPISKAQARQRAGRAGRENPGHCYRLYTEDSFEALLEHSIPEIQRCCLTSVVLQLLSLHITDIIGFPFLDPPSEESLVAALEQLYLLGAVEKKQTLVLTKLGQEMAKFPLDPPLARAILAAREGHCTEEVVSIVAMVSVESVLFTPHDQREQALATRRKFHADEGDHMMLLKVYRAYKAAKKNKVWLRENFIHSRNMKMVLEIRRQLQDICQRNQIWVTSSSQTSSQDVLMALLQGLFMNVAEVQDSCYRTVATGQTVYIHPSSCLFHTRPAPRYVFYSELLYTSKCYMRTVSVVEPEWLLVAAPAYFTKTPIT